MPSIPTHKASRLPGSGVFVKKVCHSSAEGAVEYVHRDDYYLFGLIVRGSCRISVDFVEFGLSAGEMMCIQPGQVHGVTTPGEPEAYIFFIDPVLVDPQDKQVIAEYALSPSPLRIGEARSDELMRIFMLIGSRIGHMEVGDSVRIIQNLSRAAVGIVMEAMRSVIRKAPRNRRHLEITLAFRDLLSKELPALKSPSRYAALLHISPVYLNEVVKSVTGVSAGQYIRGEIILRAKRMLVYSTLSVREIALGLGFDDPVYFTRLFTKQTGVNPSTYRNRYLGK